MHPPLRFFREWPGAGRLHPPRKRFVTLPESAFPRRQTVTVGHASPAVFTDVCRLRIAALRQRAFRAKPPIPPGAPAMPQPQACNCYYTVYAPVCQYIFCNIFANNRKNRPFSHFYGKNQRFFFKILPNSPKFCRILRRKGAPARRKTCRRQVCGSRRRAFCAWAKTARYLMAMADTVSAEK